MKNFLWVVLIVIVLAVGYFVYSGQSVEETVESVTETVTETASTATEAASEAASAATEAVGETAAAARQYPACGSPPPCWRRTRGARESVPPSALARR